VGLGGGSRGGCKEQKAAEEKGKDRSSTHSSSSTAARGDTTSKSTTTAADNTSVTGPGLGAGQRFLERVLRADSLLSLVDAPEVRSVLDAKSGKLSLEPRVSLAATSAAVVAAAANGVDADDAAAAAAAAQPVPLPPAAEKPAAMLLHPPETVPTLTLADCVFLAGPTQADLEVLVDKQLGGLLEPKFRRRSTQMATPYKAGRDGDSPISPGAGKAEKDFPSFSDRVEPRMLYSTSKDPDLDADLLPYFCFPSGVQVNIAASPTNPDREQKRTSLVPQAVQQASPGVAGKRKGAGDGNGKKAGKQNTSFSFMLSNHISTQYGLCLQVQRTVTLPARGSICQVTAHVLYCICVVTRFPFLGHLLHTLGLFEQHGGLDVPDSGECIRQCEAGSPSAILPAELCLLAELARCLDRMHVPVYPRMSAGSSSELINGAEGNVTLSALAAIPLSYDPLTISFPVKWNRRIEITFARGALQRYYLHRPGDPQDPLPVGLHVDVDDPRAIGHLQRATASRDDESVYYTLLWALPILLKHLPLDQIVLAVGCALSEMKIVVLSPDPTVVSGCLLALVHLVRPMRWAGNVVVTLPSFLNELLESPSFFFLGMERLPEDFEMTQGLVVVDPHKHEVHLHPTDIVASHTINLPQSSQLLAQLKKHAEVISHNGRRRRSVSVGDSTPSVSQRAASVRVLGPDGKSDEADPDIPLAQPCELDPDSANGASTAMAVQEFARIFREHLGALVDTALKAVLDAKAAEKALKRAGQAKIGKSLGAKIRSTSERLPSSTLVSARIQAKRGDSSSSLVSATSDEPRPSGKGKSSGMSRPASIQEKGREGSEHGNEHKDKDKDKDSDDGLGDDGDSVSSSASIPYLSPEAHLFSNKEIGDSGAKFVRRLRDTQSFSNHCFEHTEQGRRRHLEEILAEFSARARVLALWKLGSNKALSISAAYSPRGDLSGTLSNTHVADVRRRMAVDIMFTTILTGTCPLTNEQVMSLRSAYAAAVNAHASSSQLQYGEDLLDSLPAVSDYAHSLYPLSREGTMPTMLTRAETDGGILWCNGRCAGLADSPQCTSICLVLWARRVQASRQRQELKRIVERHHTAGDAVLTALTLPNGATVKLKPRALPVKHPRETDAQFRLRMQEVLGLPMANVSAGAKLLSIVEPMRQAKSFPVSAGVRFSYGSNYAEAKSPTSLSRTAAVTAATISVPTDSSNDDSIDSEYSDMPYTIANNNKRETKNGCNSGSGSGGGGGNAINAFVRHYANQRYKKQQRRRFDAALLLSVPIMRWVRARRNRVYSQAATVINSCIRSYLVRMNEEQLREILIARKLERLLACIKLRKWMRLVPHETYQRWRNGDWRHFWGRSSRFASPNYTNSSLSSLIFTGTDITVRVTSWNCRIFGVKVQDLYDIGKPGSPQDPTVALSLQQSGEKEAGGKKGEKAKGSARALDLGRTARRKHAGISCSFLEEFTVTLDELTADWHLKAEVSHENYLGGLTHIGVGCLPLSALLASVGDDRGDPSPLYFALENELPQTRIFTQVALPLEHRPHSRWRGSGPVSGSGCMLFNMCVEPQYELPLALKAKATLQATQRSRLSFCASDIDVFSVPMPPLGAGPDEPPSPYHSVQGIIGSFFLPPKTPRDSVALSFGAAAGAQAGLGTEGGDGKPAALASAVLSSVSSTTSESTVHRHPTGHVMLGRKDSLQSVLSDVTDGADYKDDDFYSNRTKATNSPTPSNSGGTFGSMYSIKQRSGPGRAGVTRQRSDLTQDMLALKKEKVQKVNGGGGAGPAGGSAADQKSVMSPASSMLNADHNTDGGTRPRRGSNGSNTSASTSASTGNSPPGTSVTLKNMQPSSCSSSDSTDAAAAAGVGAAASAATAPAHDWRLHGHTVRGDTAMLASAGGASSLVRSPIVPSDKRSSSPKRAHSPLPASRSPPRARDGTAHAPLTTHGSLGTVGSSQGSHVSATSAVRLVVKKRSGSGADGAVGDGDAAATGTGTGRTASCARSLSPSRPRPAPLDTIAATSATSTATTSSTESNSTQALASSTATLGPNVKPAMQAAEDEVFVAVSPKSKQLSLHAPSSSHPPPRPAATLRQPAAGDSREALDVTVSVIGCSSRAESDAEEPSISSRLPDFLVGLTGSQVAGVGAFTVQQVDMLCTMYDLLRAGVEIIKHGKSGDPRERMLYCDPKLSILYWMHRSSKEGRMSEQDRVSTEAGMLDRLAKDKAQGGSASTHTGMFGFKKADTDRMISLREVVDIRDDIETDIMKRSLRKGYVVKAVRRGYGGGGGGFTSADGSKVVSVLGVSRSLDVEIASADYSRLFHALQVLINYHRARRLDDEAEDTSYRM